MKRQHISISMKILYPFRYDFFLQINEIIFYIPNIAGTINQI